MPSTKPFSMQFSPALCNVVLNILSSLLQCVNVGNNRTFLFFSSFWIHLCTDARHRNGLPFCSFTACNISFRLHA